ncbi:MAG TPA: hypothetical protein VFB75_11895 [Burkholderiales bacterium]|nr:hypothetical protein [Burkholderiales bacterium]
MKITILDDYVDVVRVTWNAISSSGTFPTNSRACSPMPLESLTAS